MPENITLLPKTTNETTGGNAFNEQVIAVKKGDSVATILRDLGATPDEIGAIARCSGRAAATAASRKARSCAC